MTPKQKTLNFIISFVSAAFDIKKTNNNDK